MIHQYKMFNQNIVLDICSGSIHVVDEIAYDMIAEFLDKDKNTLVLEMKEKYPSVETSELEECYDQILELKEQQVEVTLEMDFKTANIDTLIESGLLDKGEAQSDYVSLKKTQSAFKQEGFACMIK